MTEIANLKCRLFLFYHKGLRFPVTLVLLFYQEVKFFWNETRGLIHLRFGQVILADRIDNYHILHGFWTGSNVLPV